jgi:uncharacterized protein (DUF2062 family)
MVNVKDANSSPQKPHLLKRKIREFVENAKTLQGDPSYIATGMAIGVFIGVTPTFPFHTVLAIALAFIFRGSKPAAILGVWFGNPLTMPFFYLGSYKIGMLILGHSVPFDIKYTSVPELLELGLDVTAALIVGGALLGAPPAVAAYFITRKFFTTIRNRKKTGP